jgi:transposase
VLLSQDEARFPMVPTLQATCWASRGGPIDEALAENPHLKFERLPSYSPQLNPIERFWKKLRRRATHNRLFDTLADLKRSLRASLSYFQTVRAKVASLLQPRPRKNAK